MSFTIKKLSVADVELFKQLSMFYQVDDGVIEPIITSDEYLRALLQKDSFHVIVALQDGKLIGGVTGYELEMYKEPVNEMFLYEIAVEPAHREKGVARALILSLKKICTNKGIKEMYVGTSLDNDAAMKLYRATGGVPDEEIAWFVYAC